MLEHPESNLLTRGQERMLTMAQVNYITDHDSTLTP